MFTPPWLDPVLIAFGFLSLPITVPLYIVVTIIRGLLGI